MFKKALVTIALMTLAACGSGGSSNPIPVTVPPSPIHSNPPSFPAAASGKPMAFFNSPVAPRHELAGRRMDATPTPAGSATPAPTPTPLPTIVPLPTPSGNPLVPTRVAVGSGYNAGIGTSLMFEVTDGKGNALSEATAPVLQSNWPNIITPLQPYTGANPSFPDAWAAGLAFHQQGPSHIQIAATFPDSVGIVDVYTYDAFALQCGSTTAVGLTSGNATVNPATPDASLQGCGSNPLTLNLPGGYMLAAPAQPDAFGQVTPALNNLLKVPAWNSLGTSLDASQWTPLLGQTLVIKDGVGGYHKMMIAALLYDTNNYLNGFIALDLAADPLGTFAY